MAQALLEQDLAQKLGPPPCRILDPTHPFHDPQLLSQQGSSTGKAFGSAESAAWKQTARLPLSLLSELTNCMFE